MTRSKLLWTLLAALAVALALTGVVDDAGEHYAEKAFKRALVTFAVARTLNGVISVAQGTEVAVEPGGVGVNFGVGQVLDPVNDLVERFSAVMLIAASSLGLQNVLLNMTGWWGTSLGLALVALAALAGIWWRGANAGRYEAIAVRFLLIAVFVRFAVPFLVIGSNVVFDTFLAAEQAAATEALNDTRNEIEELNAEASRGPGADESLLGRIGSMIGESLDSMAVTARLERFKQRVSNSSEHIINLIVIFVLQTIILPVVFVWMFAEALKALAARATRL